MVWRGEENKRQGSIVLRSLDIVLVATPDPFSSFLFVFPGYTVVIYTQDTERVLCRWLVVGIYLVANAASANNHH